MHAGREEYYVSQNRGSLYNLHDILAASIHPVRDPGLCPARLLTYRNCRAGTMSGPRGAILRRGHSADLPGFLCGRSL